MISLVTICLLASFFSDLGNRFLTVYLLPFVIANSLGKLDVFRLGRWFGGPNLSNYRLHVFQCAHVFQVHTVHVNICVSICVEICGYANICMFVCIDE